MELDPTDLQGIFDRIANHLLKQHKKAVIQSKNGEEQCQYKAPDGCQCAVGCLIPPNRYSALLEGKTANSMLVLQAVFGLPPGSKVPGSTRDFLEDLQAIHDRWPVEDWPKLLASLAYDRNLSLAHVPIDPCAYQSS